MKIDAWIAPKATHIPIHTSTGKKLILMTLFDELENWWLLHRMLPQFARTKCSSLFVNALFVIVCWATMGNLVNYAIYWNSIRRVKISVLWKNSFRILLASNIFTENSFSTKFCMHLIQIMLNCDIPGIFSSTTTDNFNRNKSAIRTQIPNYHHSICVNESNSSIIFDVSTDDRVASNMHSPYIADHIRTDQWNFRSCGRCERMRISI